MRQILEMETQGYATCLRTLIYDNADYFLHDVHAVDYGVKDDRECDDAPLARSRNVPYSKF